MKIYIKTQAGTLVLSQSECRHRKGDWITRVHSWSPVQPMSLFNSPSGSQVFELQLHRRCSPKEMYCEYGSAKFAPGELCINELLGLATDAEFVVARRTADGIEVIDTLESRVIVENIVEPGLAFAGGDFDTFEQFRAACKRIERPAIVLGTVIAFCNGISERIWGLKTADTPEYFEALAILMKLSRGDKDLNWSLESFALNFFEAQNTANMFYVP